MTKGLTRADIGVTIEAGLRTSLRSHGVEGDLIRGLRVPGIAPAGAEEAPPWLYMPPE
jgi:hypothetical protein